MIKLDLRRLGVRVQHELVYVGRDGTAEVWCCLRCRTELRHEHGTPVGPIRYQAPGRPVRKTDPGCPPKKRG